MTGSLHRTAYVAGQINGDVAINNADAVIENAVTDTVTKSLTSVVSPYSLTTTNPGAEAYNGYLIKFTGVLTGDMVVKCPVDIRPYKVWNATTGGYKITFQTPSGTGIDIPMNGTAAVYCNGVNVVNDIVSGVPEYSAAVSTTDATVTTIATIAAIASTTMLIEAYVTARRTGGGSGSAEDGACYVVRAAIKDVSGTATLIGSVSQIFVAEDQGGWDATIDVNSGNARIRVTGAASNNVDWLASWSIRTIG